MNIDNALTTYNYLLKYHAREIAAIVGALTEAFTLIIAPTVEANGELQEKLIPLRVGQIWAPGNKRVMNREVVIHRLSTKHIWYGGLQTGTVHRISIGTFESTGSSRGFRFMADSLEAWTKQPNAERLCDNDASPLLNTQPNSEGRNEEA
jgi:hypothetical protein